MTLGVPSPFLPLPHGWQWRECHHGRLRNCSDIRLSQR
jgi:hypothetical protein